MATPKIPLTKTIGGKRYQFHSTHRDKSDASTVAKSLRSIGLMVQVVADMNLRRYIVYTKAR